MTPPTPFIAATTRPLGLYTCHGTWDEGGGGGGGAGGQGRGGHQGGAVGRTTQDRTRECE